jgi:hypothetical protein
MVPHIWLIRMQLHGYEEFAYFCLVYSVTIILLFMMLSDIVIVLQQLLELIPIPPDHVTCLLVDFCFPPMFAYFC